jgi:hypothetical protein
MNFDFALQINPSLEKLDFSTALNIAETALKRISTTEYHSVLGKSFLGHADNLTVWVENFYQTMAKQMDVKALYFEMNEFDINTDIWYIDGFAYDQDGGLDLNDMEWLSDVTVNQVTGKEFVLYGFEELQIAFRDKYAKNGSLREARDWCEQIIITRFMELMRAAHLKAEERNLPWAKVPVYFTEHSYDFVVQSVN